MPAASFPGTGKLQQSRSWLRKDVILYFGDSLLDAGNVLRYGYPAPSERVLGEAIGEALGDDPAAVQLSLESQSPTAFKSSLNFAAWGATTAFGGADPKNPAQLRDGFDLLDQIGAYIQYLESTKPKKSVQLSRDVGAILSAGGNDLLAFVGLYELNRGVLSNQAALTGFLKAQVETFTLPSFQAAVAALDPYTDFIAILGPGNLGQTPYIQFLDGFKQANGAIIAALDAVTGFLNESLESLFDNPAADIKNVTAVDGVLALDNALDAFVADGYSVAQFWEPTPVIGSVHPSTLGSAYLSGSVFAPGTSEYKDSAVGQILADIPEFQV